MEYRGYEIKECERYTEDDYRNALDAVHPEVTVGPLVFLASRVIEEMDPIVFSTGFADYQETYYVVDGEEFDTIDEAQIAVDEWLEEA